MNFKTSAFLLFLVPGVSLLPGPAQAEETDLLTSVRDTYPWPSPDGTRIVFQSNRSGNNQLYLMNHDGSGLRQLTDYPGGAETPVFSPDGQWIVYAAYVDEEGQGNEVFVMRSDGSEKTRLTQRVGYDGHPHWSADGQFVVFNSDRSSPDLSLSWSERWHDIYRMRRDGSEVTQLTQCQSVCTYGSPSPDGRHIVYRQVTDSAAFNWSLELNLRNSEVFIADADGGNPRNISNNAAFDGWPRWSPDGKSIAISSNRAGPARVGHIHLIDTQSLAVTQLTTGDWGFTQPAWSADGNAIYAYRFWETADYEHGAIARIAVP